MSTTVIALTPISVPAASLATGTHTDRTTAFDVYERLLSMSGANPGPHADRDIRNAILETVRELPSLTMWTYFLAIYRLFLQATYSTGTVEYDHTGGAYENMLTLTDGTWPDWALYGGVRVGDRRAKVKRRISATVLQLDPIENFGEDQAAGSAYTMTRDTFTLPEDFSASDRPLNETSYGGLTYMRPHEWLTTTRYGDLTGDPRFYSFVGDPIIPGRMAMVLSPIPDQFKTLDFLYKRRMRPIRVWEANGTADVAGGALDTVTVAGTTLKAHMVGTTIRLGDDATNYPTDRSGQYPYAEERTVTQVVSTTSAIVDAPFTTTYTGAACRLSDPIDVEDGAMLNLFIAACRRRFANHRMLDGRAMLEKDWSFLLDLAKEADSRDMSRRSASLMGVYRQRLADMPRGEDIS